MSNYRGRFAPSPTGLLHFGSLFAAVMSYLHARHHHGVWLVRIEDLDPPREQMGAAEHILSCLSAHGLRSDEPVLYQSARSAYYEELLQTLTHRQHTFACPCSRKELTLHEGQHSEACQRGEGGAAIAWRFRTHPRDYCWNDLFLGPQAGKLEQDFVLKRKEGFYAYQLAVVADDIAQGITHVVRGADLLDSTPMQLALYEALEHPAPRFGHIPLLVNQAGQKLSKQNLAPALDPALAGDNLHRVFALAGFDLAPALKEPADILQAALAQWTPGKLDQATLLAPHELAD